MFGVNLQTRLDELKTQQTNHHQSQPVTPGHSDGTFTKSDARRDARVFLRQTSDQFGASSITTQQVADTIIRYHRGQSNILRLYVTIFLIFRDSDQPDWFGHFEQFLPPAWQAAGLGWFKHAMIKCLTGSRNGERSHVNIGQGHPPEPIDLSALMAECRYSISADRQRSNASGGSQYFSLPVAPSLTPAHLGASFDHSQAMSSLSQPAIHPIDSSKNLLKAPMSSSNRPGSILCPLQTASPTSYPIQIIKGAEMAEGQQIESMYQARVPDQTGIIPPYSATLVPSRLPGAHHFMSVQPFASSELVSARARSPMSLEVKVPPARRGLEHPHGRFDNMQHATISTPHEARSGSHTPATDALESQSRHTAQSMQSGALLGTVHSTPSSRLVPPTSVQVPSHQHSPMRMAEAMGLIKPVDRTLAEIDSAEVMDHPQGTKIAGPRQLRPRLSVQQTTPVPIEPIVQASGPSTKKRRLTTSTASAKRRCSAKIDTSVPPLKGDEARLMGLGLRSRN